MQLKLKHKYPSSYSNRMENSGSGSGYDKCPPTKINDVSLHQLRDKLADFARVRGWEPYHTPRNLLLALVGEVGELSEIFQWKGEVEKGLPNWSVEDKEHLEEELSDVLLYLVQLAHVCGIDLSQAALTKIIKNGEKYPIN